MCVRAVRARACVCVCVCMCTCVRVPPRSIIVATADVDGDDEWHRMKSRVLQCKQAKLIIMIAHYALMIPTDVLNHHPNVHIFGLAPHVAKCIGERFNGHGSWWLPVPTVNMTLGCPHRNISQCLSGFAMQVGLTHGHENECMNTHTWAHTHTHMSTCTHGHTHTACRV